MFYVVRERYKKNKQTNKALPITGRKNTKEKFEINSVFKNNIVNCDHNIAFLLLA